MAHVLIAYHSRTGNTKKMAEMVLEGALGQGADAVLLPVTDVDVDALSDFDAIIIGSPVYYGHCAAPVRKLFDDSVCLHGRLAGKIGGAFSSSHNLAGGNETTVLEILESMLVHGMVIQGSVEGDHYGPVALGAPDSRACDQCRALGARIARLAEALSSS